MVVRAHVVRERACSVIASVTFRYDVPVSLQVRMGRLDIEEGWTITEEEPGRIRVEHPFHGVSVHQDVPYSLQMKTMGSAESNSAGPHVPVHVPIEAGLSKRGRRKGP